MKKFLVILALAVGAALIAGCGKKEQEYRYEFEGKLVKGDRTDKNVSDVFNYFTEQKVNVRDTWIIKAESRSDADSQAYDRFNGRIRTINKSKFSTFEEKFLFRITLTSLDDGKVLDKVDYGTAAE